MTRFFSCADLDHPLAFADRKRKRFLDIDIFFGLAGIHTVHCVPVIGGCDDHCVDALVFEHFSIVVIQCRLAACLSIRRCEVGFVEIAERNDLAILVGQKGIEDLIAAITNPDETDTNPIVGADGFCGGWKRGQRTGQGKACREGSTIHRGSHD